MSQEQLFSNDTNFSSDNEMPGIRAKIIGVGGRGYRLLTVCDLIIFKVLNTWQ